MKTNLSSQISLHRVSPRSVSYTHLMNDERIHSRYAYHTEKQNIREASPVADVACVSFPVME